MGVRSKVDWFISILVFHGTILLIFFYNVRKKIVRRYQKLKPMDRNTITVMHVPICNNIVRDNDIESYGEIDTCVFVETTDASADINNTSVYEDSLVHTVIKLNFNKEIVAHLINVGCDINVKSKRGVPLIQSVIKLNKIDIVKLLLERGAIHDNSFFPNGFGPLHFAVSLGYPDIILTLLEAGADLEAGTVCYHYTPLHTACYRYVRSVNTNSNYFDIIKLLVSFGAKVDARYRYHSHHGTMLHAIPKTQAGFRLAKFLLASGADINALSDLGRTPLHEAVLDSNTDLVRLLVDKGANVGLVDLDGRTSLHYAVEICQPSIVRFLLKKGAPVDVYDKDDLDPLGFALKSRGEHFYNIFLSDFESDGASYNYDRLIGDYYNYQLAVVKPRKCMDMLLNYGADVNRVNKGGWTALQLGLIYIQHSHLLRFLLERGAVCDFNNPAVRQALEYHNDLNLLSELMRHKARLDTQAGLSSFEPGLKRIRKELVNDYVACRTEIELMRDKRLSDRVSLYRVLVTRDLGPLTRNDKVFKAFQDNALTKEFPIYGADLRARFFTEVKKQKIVAKAKKALAKLLKWDVNSYSVVLDHVMLYLTEKNLLDLIQV